jgi:aspartate aminotransferase
MLVAQSFSKNFGLYGERVGALHVVCRTEIAKSKTLSMLSRLSRAEITTCPINGARIVAKILGDEELKQQWQRDLLHMSSRMKSMRKRLVDALLKHQAPGSWDHILTDVSNLISLNMTHHIKLLTHAKIGMFSMTGLQPDQIQTLRERNHIYLLPSGRISVTGCTYQAFSYNLCTIILILT